MCQWNVHGWTCVVWFEDIAMAHPKVFRGLGWKGHQPKKSNLPTFPNDINHPRSSWSSGALDGKCTSQNSNLPRVQTTWTNPWKWSQLCCDKRLFLGSSCPFCCMDQSYQAQGAQSYATPNPAMSVLPRLPGLVLGPSSGDATTRWDTPSSPGVRPSPSTRRVWGTWCCMRSADVLGTCYVLVLLVLLVCLI